MTVHPTLTALTVDTALWDAQALRLKADAVSAARLAPGVSPVELVRLRGVVQGLRLAADILASPR